MTLHAAPHLPLPRSSQRFSSRSRAVSPAAIQPPAL